MSPVYDHRALQGVSVSFVVGGGDRDGLADTDVGEVGVGAVDAGYPVFVVVLVVSGLFNIAYFFPIISDAFLKSSPVVGTDARPIITAPLVFSVGIAIMLGLFPDAGFHFYSLARLAASTIVMGPNGGGLP